MVNTPQLSMYIATMEGEIVDVNVRLKPGHETAIFQNIVRHNFEFPEAWVPILQNWSVVCWLDLAGSW